MCLAAQSTNSSRFGLVLALLIVLAYGLLALPKIEPGSIPGPKPDTPDYVHLAQALLHGSVLVDYDGPPHLTRYSLGFPILLMPAVALGGLEATVWVPYLAALVLGILAALIAWRTGGGLAAPLAALLTLYSVGMFVMLHLVMSDVPSTAIALAELALLALMPGTGAAIAAGLLAGLLVWIRPASLVLGLAGFSGLTATHPDRKRLVWYGLGLSLPVILLAAWQWTAFGSPLLTSYQAAGGTSDGSPRLSSLFGLQYVMGPPWNAYSAGTEPNLLVYIKGLIGIDNDETYPGLGLLGFVGGIIFARRSGAAGAVSRFSLATNVLILLVYVPYFYRDLRFLMLPVTLNHITAAVMLAAVLSAVRKALPGRVRAASVGGRG